MRPAIQFIGKHLISFLCNLFQRVGIANKPGVVPYQPFLPAPSLFQKGQEFKDFLLTKCKQRIISVNNLLLITLFLVINGERAAMFSPEFKSKFVTTKRTQLEMILEKYLKSVHEGKGRRSPITPRKSPQVPRKFDDTPASNNSSTVASPTNDLESYIEKIVNMGKSTYQLSLKESQNFDAAAFRDGLHQV
jgi:hypothetical protein